MDKKLIIKVIIVFVLSFSATFFIIKSNDHKECRIISKKTKDKNGVTITSEEHICNEKFSF